MSWDVAAALLVVCIGLVVAGVAMFSPRCAFITAGVLLAAWTLVVMGAG